MRMMYFEKRTIVGTENIRLSDQPQPNTTFVSRNLPDRTRTPDAVVIVTFKLEETKQNGRNYDENNKI
jgi:hypothetical protein